MLDGKAYPSLYCVFCVLYDMMVFYFMVVVAL